MTQEEKMDEILKMLTDLKAQMDNQDEKIEYIVGRLEHMRHKAHQAREKETAWPK